MAHIPVLLNEVIEGLSLSPGETVLDGTVGYGGHSKLLAEKVAPDGLLIGIDQDSDALEKTQDLLKEAKVKVLLLKGNFRNMVELLHNKEIFKIDACLLDLGLSSVQLDSSKRGFSFREDEKLLMTFGSEFKLEKLTAADIVNTWAEEDIANVLYAYGEERFARRIAKAIVLKRTDKPIETTFELVQVVESAVPTWYRKSKIHPATRTFQGLRIAVNDELSALREGLAESWLLLNSGGRLAVISFHSLEARIVKEFFKNKKISGEGEILTKKAKKPTSEEIKNNPRSRSAQLRIIRKI